MPQFATGRPNKKDEDEILLFSEMIKSKYNENNTKSIEVKGNMPYQEYNGIPLKPNTSKKYSKCGICASKCPVNAILFDNPKVTDASKCIFCIDVLSFVLIKLEK